MKEWQHTGAFVIQFRAEAEMETGQFEGRVEHVASTRSTHFQSLDEFLAFVTQVLRQVRAGGQEGY